MNHDDEDAALASLAPLVDAEVARALAPYHAKLDPEMVAEMERLLRVMLTTHPAAIAALRAQLPGQIFESGTVAPFAESAAATPLNGAAKRNVGS
jgi:hypothetical protein